MLTKEQIAALEELGAHVAAQMPNDVLGVEMARDELVVHIRRPSLLKVLSVLRDDSNYRFSQLVEVTAIDRPEREERFEVAYCLLSMKHNQRLRVKLTTDETTPVPSATGIYSSAGWLERETWDMFGILFSDHPDLRRILTDYGFEGHPLRKDFPTTGHVEVHYDEAQRRVVYAPVELPQAMRTWDFLSPWEGAADQRLFAEETPARSAEGKS